MQNKKCGFVLLAQTHESPSFAKSSFECSRSHSIVAAAVLVSLAHCRHVMGGRTSKSFNVLQQPLDTLVEYVIRSLTNGNFNRLKIPSIAKHRVAAKEGSCSLLTIQTNRLNRSLLSSLAYCVQHHLLTRKMTANRNVMRRRLRSASRQTDPPLPCSETMSLAGHINCSTLPHYGV
jgi:hypothetical protein